MLNGVALIQLLNGIIITLPFLAVRIVYGVLSSFAPFPITFENGQEVPNNSDSALAKFSATSSDWAVYLVMSVLMEYIVVVVYATVGLLTPLGKDQPRYDGANVPPLNQPMYGNAEGYSMDAFRTPGYARSAYGQGYTSRK